jgi:hypothetical protein
MERDLAGDTWGSLLLMRRLSWSSEVDDIATVSTERVRDSWGPTDSTAGADSVGHSRDASSTIGTCGSVFRLISSIDMAETVAYVPLHSKQ